MAKGVQAKLGRGERRPKVHITYDSAIGEGMEKIELPFVVGVMADLSIKPVTDADGDKVPVRKRAFKEVDRDNFGQYMAAVRPETTVKVDNKLDASGGSVSAKLAFKSMGDFQPDKVAEQVPALKQLLDLRKNLDELKAKLDGNDKLHKTLHEILDKTAQAMQAAGGGGAGDAPAAAPAGEDS